MDSQGHAQATESAAQPAPDATARETSPGEAFRESLRHFAEIREYAGYYITAKLDSLRLGIRNVIILAALGIVGLIAVAAVIVTAVVLALVGVAGALAKVLPAGSEWAANLITGTLFLILLGIVVVIGVSRLTRASRLNTVEKYERRKRSQQTRFGHDLDGRA
jgi:hypothetical protein